MGCANCTTNAMEFKHPLAKNLIEHFNFREYNFIN